jgi:hypothetical protein
MRRWIRTLFVSVVSIILITGISAATLLAQDEPAFATSVDSNLEILGQYGGLIFGATVQGDYAYAAVGLKFVTLNITDRSAPQEVGYVLLPGKIRWIEIAGSYAYVSVELVGLVVVNISNPAAPLVVATLSYPDIAYDTGKVVVSGQQVFLLSDGKLRIIDVTNPAAPAQIGLYEHSALSVFSLLDAANGRVFVGLVEGNCLAGSGACANRVQIVNVVNPASPVEEGYVSGELPYDAAVYQSWLYVSDYYGPVKAIDISNPMTPIVLEASFPGFGALGLLVDANYLHMIESMAMNILSLANPTSPTSVGYYRPPAFINAVDVVDSYAYVTTSDGLHIVNLQSPAQPLDVARYVSPVGTINGAVGSGDYLYVQKNTGFTIMNAANPLNLTEAGAYTGDGEGIDRLNVDGNYAYLFSFSGLQIIDISNPAAPQKVGGWKGQGSPHDLSVQGNYVYVMAYIMNDDYELQIVDISDRSTPTLVGSMIVPRGSIKASGNYVYCICKGSVRIIDVSNPLAPQLVATYDEIEPESILVVGSTAYVAGYGGIDVVDVANPATPQKQATIDLPGIYHVAVDGNILYAATSGGLWVLDISSISTPVVVQQFPLRVYEGLSVHRGTVYLPERSNGLYIIGRRTFVPTDFLFLPSLFMQ